MSPGVEESAINQICGLGFYPIDFSQKEKKNISQLLFYLKYLNGFGFL